MFIQGISLRISINSAFRRNLKEGYSPLKATWLCVWKCFKRAVILYLLTWLINESHSFKTIRYLGGSSDSPLSHLVLAYFAVSGFVHSLVLLFAPVYHVKEGVRSRWNARANYENSEDIHE